MNQKRERLAVSNSPDGACCSEREKASYMRRVSAKKKVPREIKCTHKKGIINEEGTMGRCDNDGTNHVLWGMKTEVKKREKKGDEKSRIRVREGS